MSAFEDCRRLIQELRCGHAADISFGLMEPLWNELQIALRKLMPEDSLQVVIEKNDMENLADTDRILVLIALALFVKCRPEFELEIDRIADRFDGKDTYLALKQEHEDKLDISITRKTESFMRIVRPGDTVHRHLALEE